MISLKKGKEKKKDEEEEEEEEEKELVSASEPKVEKRGEGMG